MFRKTIHKCDALHPPIVTKKTLFMHAYRQSSYIYYFFLTGHVKLLSHPNKITLTRVTKTNLPINLYFIFFTFSAGMLWPLIAARPHCLVEVRK